MNDGHDLAPAAHSGLPAPCALCHRFFSPDNEGGDLQMATICGDCKFLLLEDHGTPLQEDYRTMIRRLRRRRRHISSESIEDLFSQQFSHVINQAWQNRAPSYENDTLMMHGDATLLVRRTSTRTTPSGSRRWSRVLSSDTESDGFDSFFGESDSNFSFSSSRFFHDESDAVSAGPYEGGYDADASVDDSAFLENEDYSHPGLVSESETDDDIDPMRAGLYHWNSEDIEEEDVDEYIVWEETEAGENAFASLEPGAPSHGQQAVSPWQDSTSHLRIQGSTRGTFADVFANLEQQAGQSYIRSPRDYLRAGGFEELLEHLEEAESSRRGAPPAAISVVRNLPHLVISGDPEKLDGLACAVCKDSLPVGTVVNQLPCLHLYHPSCILPWLSSRNSCPLCRYELPTDDKDYEDRKQRNHAVLNFHGIPLQEISEGSSLDENNVAGEVEQVNVHRVGERENIIRSSSSRGWVFLAAAAAAAPFVGAFLMLCLGNRVTGRRWRSGGTSFSATGRHHPSRCLVSCTLALRDGGQNRAWWFFS